jgi:hypothetical protein
MTSNACNITNNWREVLEKCDGQKVVIFYFDLHHNEKIYIFIMMHFFGLLLFFAGGVKP